jgi:hypothetical protein
MTALPQPHAVIGLFVIGGRETLVEAAKRMKAGSRREQEGAGAIIHIALEHHIWRRRVLTPRISAAGAVLPDDGTGFLQRAIRQDDPPADRTNRVVAVERAQRAVQAAGQQLCIVVQQQKRAAARLGRREIDRLEKVQIGAVAGDDCPLDPVEQSVGFVG